MRCTETYQSSARLAIHELGLSTVRGSIHCLKVRTEFESNYSSNPDVSVLLKGRLDCLTSVEKWVLKDLESERFSFLEAVNLDEGHSLRF